MALPPPDQLGQLFEDSPIPLLFCDAERIEHANAACAELLGYPDTASVCELAPDAFVAEPDHTVHRRALRRLLSGESRWEQWSLVVTRRDGTPIHAHLSAQRFPSPDGTRVFVTLLDVSQQRAEALRLARLARAVSLVSEPVWIADEEGTVLYANRALGALLGTTPEDLIGAPGRSFLVDETNMGALMESLRGPDLTRHLHAEIEVCSRSGRTFPAEVSLTAFSEPGSTQGLVIALGRDLTEARRLEQERALRERQLDLMLREAHHRIKNNLQVTSDLLALQAAGEPPAVREALAAAARRIRALAAVHEGIRVDQDVTEVQACPLISAVLHDLQEAPTISPPDIRFELALEDHAVTSRAASALALITAELVSNALEHGEPRTVRVAFEASDGSAALEICDDGRSGPAESHRSHSSFGLRLVRLLAEEQLHGSFALTREENWTRALVRFPLAGDGHGD